VALNNLVELPHSPADSLPLPDVAVGAHVCPRSLLRHSVDEKAVIRDRRAADIAAGRRRGMIVRLARERADLAEVEAHERELVVILLSKSVQPGSIALDQSSHLQLADEIFERKLEMRGFHGMPVEDQEME